MVGRFAGLELTKIIKDECMHQVTSLDQELHAIRTVPWPPDEFLAGLDVGTLPPHPNRDTSEIPSDVDILHAQSGQDNLINALLAGGEAIYRQQYPQLAALYAQTRLAVQEAPDHNSRLLALREATDRGLVLPVSLHSDVDHINVRPFILNLGSPAVREKSAQQHANRQGHRFYLNPPLRDLPEVARLLILENAGKDTLFHFKFIDVYQPDLYQNTDKLIVTTSTADGGAVLDILRRVKGKVPRAFEGRLLPELVYPLEEGIGYAADTQESKSYTNDRVDLLWEAAKQVGDSLRVMSDRERVIALRRAIGQIAITSGRDVDPVNIALHTT